MGDPLSPDSDATASNTYSQRSLDEIFNGKVDALPWRTSKTPCSMLIRGCRRAGACEVVGRGAQPGHFIGLVPLVRAYLLSISVDVETECSLGRYLSFISDRAAGTARGSAPSGVPC